MLRSQLDHHNAMGMTARDTIEHFNLRELRVTALTSTTIVDEHPCATAAARPHARGNGYF